ncbi:unnamed protein product [Rotaria sp. Silwood2]|nr:unnamed protein product [Rotaria sp. Silwood2]CAF2814411.1 unnamed protein product [Rotaria sp. Silwood2]CAF3216844.1 unnamed protein product [Rotaria sp. Silwood2]CAF4027193.1 unnamed protein product [Rotaria sp. Silwood2]CAF4476886.1 unnamed protein product [Rotaria sp. Silwood2]
MPNILFFKDTDSELKSLQQSISSEWLHLLQVFRDFSQGNGLISILGTNVEMKLGEAGINGRVLILPKTYNNGTCSCATSIGMAYKLRRHFKSSRVSSSY